MPDDGRPLQPLENANLDFLRIKSDQAIKATAETFQRLTRKADDQIGMIKQRIRDRRP